MKVRIVSVLDLDTHDLEGAFIFWLDLLRNSAKQKGLPLSPD